MLHKLIIPSRIDGEMRGIGYIFDLPDGTKMPGSHAQGEGGQLVFRAYAEPLSEEEAEDYQAEQAKLKQEAEATREAEEKAAAKVASQPAPEPPKGQLVRLTAPALVHGALRDGGYEFFLAEGEKGPMRAVRKGHERIDMENDTRRIDAEVVHEPLYEAVKE